MESYAIWFYFNSLSRTSKLWVKPCPILLYLVHLSSYLHSYSYLKFPWDAIKQGFLVFPWRTTDCPLGARWWRIISLEKRLTSTQLYARESFDICYIYPPHGAGREFVQFLRNTIYQTPMKNENMCAPDKAIQILEVYPKQAGVFPIWWQEHFFQNRLHSMNRLTVFLFIEATGLLALPRSTADF